ncbi:MAG: hypothetical protein JXR79_07860 [Nitrospirae bacterium]|nr:hypothetical protein [Nitrospirota bacterium]
MFKIISRTLAVFVLPLLFAVSASAYSLESVGEDMDNYFVPAFPAAYGEVIDRLPPEMVGNIPAVLKALEVFGYVKSLGDISLKLDSGDNMGAALDAATTATNLAISLLKDGATNKVIVGGIGISTIPITALMVTIDITRKSYEAVQASKTALDLERFYYIIQQDPVLKVKGRKLGEGDPILITQSTIDHLWRKVIFDEQWKGLFKNYVTSELGLAWPEPSFWDKLTVNSDKLEDAVLFENAKNLKSHIAGLLKELNKVAKQEEARVVLSKAIKELEAQFGKLSPNELAAAIVKYADAAKRIPDVEAYVQSLKGKTEEYRTRMQKATVTDLVSIRDKEIMNELSIITNHATKIRFLTPSGPYGGKRTELLTKLRTGYKELASLISAANKSELNARLIAESKKLEVSGTEFVFKRHECKYSFDDVKAGFEDKVVRGAADAMSAVGNAKAEIQKNIDESSEAYKKDRIENENLYNTKKAELEEEIKKLGDRLSRTKETKERYELIIAIERLKTQLSDLKKRYQAYLSLFGVNFNTDKDMCEGSIKEINTFVQSNSNRHAMLQDVIKAAYRSASSVYSSFFNNTQSNVRQILSAEQIQEVEKIVANAEDSYAGLDFEFLRKHLVNDKDAPRSQNIRNTITKMNEAVMKYHNSLYNYRMTYYVDWEKRLIPSLHFMGSSAAKESANHVIREIEKSLAILKSSDVRSYPISYRDEYNRMIENLQGLKKSMENVLQLFSKTSSLGDKLEAYASRALKNNTAIAQDSEYMWPLVRAFYMARQSVEYLIVMFIADSRNNPKKVLYSDKIFSVLRDSGVAEWSKKLELGIVEELMNEPFVEMRKNNDFIHITKDHFKEADSKIKQAPTSDYSSFLNPLFKLSEEKSGAGLVMELLLKSANDFTDIFKDDAKLSEQSALLLKTFKDRKDIAERNQQIIDDRKARFNIVLNRVNQFIDAVKQSMTRGDYSTAAAYEATIVDVKLQYEDLKSKRKDIDDAFARFYSLVAEAKSKVTMSGTGMGSTGPDAAKIQELYTGFKEAYESRNDSLVMSFMGDSWEAGDGTTLSDLQVNLSRTFRAFDEIRYSIQNINVQPSRSGVYNVTYDVTITSRMFMRNIKHEEKSTVSEEVTITESGKPKITKTLSGRFWYVQ